MMASLLEYNLSKNLLSYLFLSYFQLHILLDLEIINLLTYSKLRRVFFAKAALSQFDF